MGPRHRTHTPAVLLRAQEPLRFAWFSPNGAQIVTGSSASTVARLWDAKTGTERAVLKGHDDPVYRAVFSPDGTRLLTVSHDKTVRLWSALTGRQLVDSTWEERGFGDSGDIFPRQ